MSDTPPPAAQPSDAPPPDAHWAGVSPATVSDTPAFVPPFSPPPPVGFLGHAAVSAVIGVIFLMTGGADFAQWLMHPVGNPHGVEWTEGPLAGQPVAYFDLELGAAWRDVGLFATAVTLGIEAILFVLMHLRPAVARPLLTVAFVVALVGCCANGLSAVMQYRAGWHQPTYAVIGLAVCVVSAVSAHQRRKEICV